MAVEADKISTFREQLHSLIDEPWIPIKGALDLIKQVLYLFDYQKKSPLFIIIIFLSSDADEKKKQNQFQCLILIMCRYLRFLVLISSQL